MASDALKQVVNAAISCKNDNCTPEKNNEKCDENMVTVNDAQMKIDYQQNQNVEKQENTSNVISHEVTNPQDVSDMKNDPVNSVSASLPSHLPTYSDQNQVKIAFVTEGISPNDIVHIHMEIEPSNVIQSNTIAPEMTMLPSSTTVVRPRADDQQIEMEITQQQLTSKEVPSIANAKAFEITGIKKENLVTVEANELPPSPQTALNVTTSGRPPASMTDSTIGMAQSLSDSQVTPVESQAQTKLEKNDNAMKLEVQDLQQVTKSPLIVQHEEIKGTKFEPQTTALKKEIEDDVNATDSEDEGKMHSSAAPEILLSMLQKKNEKMRDKKSDDMEEDKKADEDDTSPGEKYATALTESQTNPAVNKVFISLSFLKLFGKKIKEIFFTSH